MNVEDKTESALAYTEILSWAIETYWVGQAKNFNIAISGPLDRER